LAYSISFEILGVCDLLRADQASDFAAGAIVTHPVLISRHFFNHPAELAGYWKRVFGLH
jgi:hypothetical protein